MSATEGLEQKMARNTSNSDSKRFTAVIGSEEHADLSTLAETLHPVTETRAGMKLVLRAAVALLRHPELAKEHNFTGVDKDPNEIFRIIEAYKQVTEGKKSMTTKH